MLEKTPILKWIKDKKSMNTQQFPWQEDCPKVSNYCDKHLRGYSIGSPWHGVINLAFDLERENALLKQQLETTQKLCLKFYEALQENGFELEIT